MTQKTQSVVTGIGWGDSVIRAEEMATERLQERLAKLSVDRALSASSQLMFHDNKFYFVLTVLVDSVENPVETVPLSSPGD